MTTDPGVALAKAIRGLERSRWYRAAGSVALELAGRGLLAASGVALIAGLISSHAVLRWGVMAVGVGFVVWPLRRGGLAPRTGDEVARALEALCPTLRGRLRPALDLVRRVPPGTSPQLARMAQEEALERLRSVDAKALRGARAPLPWRTLALGTLWVLFLRAVAGPEAGAWVRKACPWWDPPPPRVRLLAVAPPDTSIAAGSRLLLRAIVAPYRPPGISFEVRRPGMMDETRRATLVRREGGGALVVHEVAFPEGDFQYRVVTTDTSSRWFSVSQFAPLRFIDAAVTIHPPAYTRLPPARETGLPREIRAPRGSTVSLWLNANNPLISCVVHQPRPCSLAVSGHTAEGELPVGESGVIAGCASDAFDQRLALGPLPLVCVADEPAVIESLVPGTNGLLPRELRVMVGLVARDDFGLSRVGIRFAAGEREDTLLLARGLLGPRGRWGKRWDLSRYDLLPDDVVSYRFEVYDNDAVTGPKLTASPWFSLRFPALEEIVASVWEEQEDLIDSLEALVGEGTSLHEELSRIAADLVGASSTDWGTRDDLRALAAHQQNLAERLGQVAERLAQLERAASEQELFSAQIMEKVATVRRLLENVRIPELEKALQELQEAIDTVTPQELERALARISAHQEEILRGLDRAIETLRSLEAAQRLSALTRTAERLKDEQERLMEAVPTPSQAPAQERVGMDLALLDEALRGLTKDMRGIVPSLAESLQAASRRLEESRASEAIEAAARALSAGSSEAIQHQALALAGLQQLAADLQAAEQAMAGQDLARVLEELDRASALVADLAFEQEALADQPDPVPHDHARQKGIAEALRALRGQLEDRLPKAVGQASSDLLGTLARAQSEVDGAVAGASRAHRRSAVRALNVVQGALAGLRRSLEASATASCSGVEDLFGLSQAQGRLNRACQSLLPRPGGLSRETLASLAARQQVLREQLASIMRRTEGRASVTGDLGSIGEEMEEVVRGLEERGLDREIIDRQRRILSRLLDAQRSIRRQGLARQRLAEPARTQSFLPGDPLQGALPTPSPAPPPRRDDVYPPAYREAIEAYFRALSAPER